MTVTEVEIQDDSGKVKAVWFNQPYLAEQLAEGKNIRVSGKIHPVKSPLKRGLPLAEFNGVPGNSGDLYFSNPAWELAARVPTNTGRLVPVYPETEGLSSRWLRWQIQNFLKQLGHPMSFGSFGRETSDVLTDPLPPPILKKLNLPEINKALRYIHFPDTLDHALVAQKRFAFEEMLVLQLKSLQVKNAWRKENAARIKFDEKLIKGFVLQASF